MAKRKAFEEQMSEFEGLLETEISWPQAGDQAFRTHEDVAGNTPLEQNAKTRLVLMTDGYKLGADAMVEAATQDPHESASLVFPIIFNYRHFIELSLKYLIETYGAAVGIAPIWNSHDLNELWHAYSLMLERYGTSDPDEADPAVEMIVAEFTKIDPGSFSLRYPVDTRGREIPLERNELDLSALRDAMNALDAYFTGADGFLDTLKDS